MKTTNSCGHNSIFSNSYFWKDKVIEIKDRRTGKIKRMENGESFYKDMKNYEKYELDNLYDDSTYDSTYDGFIAPAKENKDIEENKRVKEMEENKRVKEMEEKRIEQANNKFFMIFADGPTSVQHLSYDLALVEAHRLLRKHPTKTFYIMECRAAVLNTVTLEPKFSSKVLKIT